MLLNLGFSLFLYNYLKGSVFNGRCFYQLRFRQKPIYYGCNN